MGKIKVKVCLGTTCFVMGGSKQQELIERVSCKYGEKIDVESATCLDLCQNNEFTSAPYVMVDDDVVSEANTEKVIEKIEKKINNEQ